VRDSSRPTRVGIPPITASRRRIRHDQQSVRASLLVGGCLVLAFIALELFLFVAVSIQTNHEVLALSPRYPNQEIASLLRDINVSADLLHSEITPATTRLVSIGMPAIKPTLDLFLSDDRSTRLRASHVVVSIVARIYGFRPDHGWSFPKDKHQWDLFIERKGTLDPDVPVRDRINTVYRWKQWIDSSEFRELELSSRMPRIGEDQIDDVARFLRED
jgi:hypothetical protein